MDFKELLAKAKQVQAASGQNGNLRDHVGEQMVVTGMHITEGIEIDDLVVDKVTFFLADSTALDGFHQVAVDRAEELITVLGEGPYPVALLMEVCEIEVKKNDPKKRRMNHYAKLIDFAGTDSDLAFAELDAAAQSLDVPPTDPTPSNDNAAEQPPAETKPKRNRKK